MRRLALLLVRLYPPAWRTRYGAEMSALLEDTNATPGTMFNLLKGALRMQLSVRSFPRLALLLSLTGLILGFAASWLVTPRYISTAVLDLTDVSRSPTPRPDLTNLLLQLQQETLSRTSLSAIIQDPRLDLYPDERMKQPLEDIIEAMRKKDIRITLLQASAGPVAAKASPTFLPFEISYSYQDAHKAQQVVQTLITQYSERNYTRSRAASGIQPGIDQISLLEARIAALESKLGLKPGPAGIAHDPLWSTNVEVLDPPSLPQVPAWPNRAAFASIGFAAGLILALLISLVRYLGRPSPAPVALA